MKALFLALALLPAFLTAQETVDALPEGFFPPAKNAPRETFGACPTCKGTKFVEKERLKTQSLSLGNQIVPRTVCPRCKGQGRCMRPRPVEEWLAEQQQILNAYEREHRTAQRIPVGAGFMDRAAAEAMAPAARAALAAKFPKRCATCLGLGVDTCNKCDGLGLVTRTERAKTKDGESVEFETEETCSACGGTGAKPCRRCKGSGLAKVCSRCDGLGTTEVRARRNIPAHTELCRSCDGDGRR